MAEDEYDDRMLAMLELIWGEGLSVTGRRRGLVRDRGLVSRRDRPVLDIGCGIGGVDLVLAREYGALMPALIEAPGRNGQARFEETWRTMTVVLGEDELRPGAPLGSQADA